LKHICLADETEEVPEHLHSLIQKLQAMGIKIEEMPSEEAVIMVEPLQLYQRDMGTSALLSREQEIALAQNIEAGTLSHFASSASSSIC
jgi:Sigma-70 factor, region 1.2